MGRLDGRTGETDGTIDRKRNGSHRGTLVRRVLAARGGYRYLLSTASEQRPAQRDHYLGQLRQLERQYPGAELLLQPGQSADHERPESGEPEQGARHQDGDREM